MSNSCLMSSGADVNRLISEEQIIDTVFQTCDVSCTGWVQVSRLVDCVAALSQHNVSKVCVFHRDVNGNPVFVFENRFSNLFF